MSDSIIRCFNNESNKPWRVKFSIVEGTAIPKVNEDGDWRECIDGFWYLLVAKTNTQINIFNHTECFLQFKDCNGLDPKYILPGNPNKLHVSFTLKRNNSGAYISHHGDTGSVYMNKPNDGDVLIKDDYWKDLPDLAE